jgi:bifunctional oligoribonuclease and PAP phosphatase NrnA
MRIPAPLIEEVRVLLGSAADVLVITHVSPDGDAISSLSAVGLALRQMGKSFRLVCDDGLPARFQFLPLADQVRHKPQRKKRYDLIIALDSGDVERLGKAFLNLPQPRPPVLNIDHHPTNTHFGSLNLVDAGANSTTEILYWLFSGLGLPWSADLADALLTGLVTDTLNFQTAGVQPETLRIAADLMEAGADLYQATTAGLNMKEYATLQLWRVGLDNMRLEDGVLWTTVSRLERENIGHGEKSSLGLSNLLSNVYGAAMSAVLLELEDGRVSVGFRCRPPYRVSDLAQELGGGGHHLAAGCTVDGPLAEAAALVVSRSKAAVRRQQRELERARDDSFDPDR